LQVAVLIWSLIWSLTKNAAHQNITTMNPVIEQALNSTALTMIKGGCYPQAAETLKDAISVMQSSMVQLETTPFSSQPQQAQMVAVAAALEKANQRVFNPVRASLVPAFSIKVIHHEGTIEEEEISAEKNEHALLDCMASVIRMESTEIVAEEAIAILLYNSAICWFCLAKSSTAKGALIVRRLEEKAVMLLKAALATLDIVYHESQECPFITTRIISLMRIVCGTLVKVLSSSSSMGQNQAAIALRTTTFYKLEELDTLAKEYAASDMFKETVMAASPAA
jgi:hypothetical protein